MAKPIQVAGLSRRTPVARTSTKVLRATLLDLLEKFPEARSGASEKGVHDLRVAVKRFREAFRLFRPILPKKTFRRHRDWIEDLNDALGEVRDRDVALARLHKLTAGLAESPLSVADLVARLDAERIAAARALAAMLDRFQLEGVPARLSARIESLEQQAAPGGPTHEFARERGRERPLDVRSRWSAGSSLCGTRRSARSGSRGIEPLDARRSRRLQADGPRTPLSPRRGQRKARPVGLSEGPRRERGDRRRHRAARGRRGGGRARADGAAAATRRAEAGRGLDLDRVLPHGLRRPRDAARETQDPLAELRRSDGRARPGEEPARAALGESHDLARDRRGAAAPSSRSPRRRALCRVDRGGSARAHPSSRRPAPTARTGLTGRTRRPSTAGVR